MARQQSTTEPVRMIDRFRYTPGDGRVYVWHAGAQVVTVYRIVTRNAGNGLDLQATGDTIDVSDVDTATATVLANRVDQWRGSR